MLMEFLSLWGQNQLPSFYLESYQQTKKGYIIAGEDGVTNIPGIFAAGDGRSKNLRQVVTAVSDGANCVYSVERYLQNA